jgi:imidazolonepropionase-like amidohydrolase
MLRVFLIAFVLAGSAAAVQAQTIAIRAGRLIDPESGTASRNQVILIEDGLIKAAGEGVSIPANAKVVD